MRRGLRTLAFVLNALAAGPCLAAPPDQKPEDRALAYLAREVPQWSKANRCFSCHNNGDAARALYAAKRLGLKVPDEALLDTNRWLAKPDGWEHNGGDGPFSDKRLARAEFTSALAAAVEAGQVRDREPLMRAAKRLAEDQSSDGSWPIDGNSSVGSPATYGRPLLTFSARESLRAADPKRFRTAIDRADRWVLGQAFSNTPDACAVLMIGAASALPEARDSRNRALDLLQKGQSEDGGWGPFSDSPPEAFDTAIAMLALNRVNDPPASVRGMIARGRAFLVAAQNTDGSWTETTRPSGGESYAQRLSTTGWATLAVLETEKAKQVERLGRPKSSR